MDRVTTARESARLLLTIHQKPTSAEAICQLPGQGVQDKNVKLMWC
jgi:hypothetical protein